MPAAAARRTTTTCCGAPRLPALSSPAEAGRTTVSTSRSGRRARGGDIGAKAPTPAPRRPPLRGDNTRCCRRLRHVLRRLMWVATPPRLPSPSFRRPRAPPERETLSWCLPARTMRRERRGVARPPRFYLAIPQRWPSHTVFPPPTAHHSERCGVVATSDLSST